MAIIGGSGVYRLSFVENLKKSSIDTPYGQVTVREGIYNGQKIIFLNRHGEKHSIPPHKINYLANIWAFKKLGIETIIATNSVGSLDRKIKPGSVIFCNDFIDFTKTRKNTFFDHKKLGVIHTDMTVSYCPALRHLFSIIAKKDKIPYRSRGVMAVTDGPRFETPAEIKAYRRLGADVVGMTSAPEIILARELNMCYGSIGIVSNYAAGINHRSLTSQEVFETLEINSDKITRLIAQILNRWIANKTKKCPCDAGNNDYKKILEIKSITKN